MRYIIYIPSVYHGVHVLLDQIVADSPSELREKIKEVKNVEGKVNSLTECVVIEYNGETSRSYVRFFEQLNSLDFMLTPAK